MPNNTLSQIAEQLINAKTVAVFCHQRPDGDAIGSGLALVTALRNAGKQAWLVLEEAPPSRFDFISGIEQAVYRLPSATFDTYICMDCGDVTRLGAYVDTFQRFKGVRINIDHHITNSLYGKYNYVLDCSATCEILPEIFQQAGFPITERIANYLMVGLMTDSGNFVHQDVTAKTYRVAAQLREQGADITQIHYEMFTRQSKQRALLFARVLGGMRFALDDTVCFLTTTQKDLQTCQADRSMTEGFVDFPLSITSVQVSVAILEHKKGQYKVSLRSKGKVNVNAVAGQFGGGGHVLASGCMVFGEYEEVIERLTYAVYQYL